MERESYGKNQRQTGKGNYTASFWGSVLGQGWLPNRASPQQGRLIVEKMSADVKLRSLTLSYLLKAVAWAH
jgi:hypothetical protein